MKGRFELLQSGEITWSDFVKRTDGDWMRISATLIRRHRLPACVGLDDIKQELLLWAWIHFEKWNPEGGQPLHRFVTIGAISRARAWLNKQRNSLRRNDGAASRIPVALGDMAREDFTETDVVDCIIRFEPVQELIASKRQIGQALIDKAENQRNRECISAFIQAEGCMDTASEVLYGDTTRRRICRFSSEKDVRRAIRRAIQRTL